MVGVGTGSADEGGEGALVETAIREGGRAAAEVGTPFNKAVHLGSGYHGHFSNFGPGGECYIFDADALEARGGVGVYTLQKVNIWNECRGEMFGGGKKLRWQKER